MTPECHLPPIDLGKSALDRHSKSIPGIESRKDLLKDWSVIVTGASAFKGYSARIKSSEPERNRAIVEFPAHLNISCKTQSVKLSDLSIFR